MFFRSNKSNNHCETRTRKFYKLHGSRQKLLLSKVRRKIDAEYLNTKDGTDKSKMTQLNRGWQMKRSHISSISSEPRNEILQEDNDNLQRIPNNMLVQPHKQGKSTMNPNKFQEILLHDKICKRRLDKECERTRLDNPMSDDVLLESTDLLSKGESERQLHSILRDLKINESKIASINSNGDISDENQTKSTLINETVKSSPPTSRVLPISFPNTQRKNKDVRKNRTISEVKYNLTDNVKKSKVFFSFKKESWNRPSLLKRRKKGVNSYRSMSSCTLDSALLSKKQAAFPPPPPPPPRPPSRPHQHQEFNQSNSTLTLILGPKQNERSIRLNRDHQSVLDARNSYRSMSQCTLDSTLLSKKQAIFTPPLPPPPPPQPHQLQDVTQSNSREYEHNMLAPVIFELKQKDKGIRPTRDQHLMLDDQSSYLSMSACTLDSPLLGKKKAIFTTSPPPPTLIEIVDDIIFDIETVLSLLFRGCTSVSE